MADTILDKTALPFDGTDAADLAIDRIASLVSAVDGGVHVIMVLDPYVENELADFAEVEHVTIEQAAIKSCERLTASIAERGIPSSYETVNHDDVVEGVVETARSAGCTAIVLPTHGFSTVTRWLTGNLRNKIVENAGLPVIVIPPKR